MVGADSVFTRRSFLRNSGVAIGGGVAVLLSAACGGTTAGSVAATTSNGTVAGSAASALTATTSAASTVAAQLAAATTTAASLSTSSAAVATSSAASTALASTAATATTSAASAQPSGGGKSLQYWTWWNPSNPSFTSWWKYVKPDYESKHPGWTLQTSFVADDADYETKLLAAVAGGVPPDALHLDIVFAWDTWKHGVLADLSSYVARTPAVAPDQFFAAAKTYTQQGGHTFGVATEGPAGYALAYNLDHFKEAGLAPPTASWSWQDFTDAAVKLTKRSGDTITQSGWLGAAGSVEYFCDWLYSDGGAFYKPDYSGVAFDDGRGAAVLQFLNDMLNKNRVSATLPTGTTPYKAFVAEQASMMTFGMYLIPTTAQQAPLLHYDIMPFPRGPQGKGPATALEYDMEVVPKDAKDQDASWAWISYYAGAEVQAQLPTKIGFVSPRKNVYQTAAWKSVLQQYPLLDRVATIAALPDVQAYPFVETAQLYKVLPPIFNAALNGQQAVATAVTQAADAVKTILAQANA